MSGRVSANAQRRRLQEAEASGRRHSRAEFPGPDWAFDFPAGMAEIVAEQAQAVAAISGGLAADLKRIDAGIARLQPLVATAVERLRQARDDDQAARAHVLELERGLGSEQQIPVADGRRSVTSGDDEVRYRHRRRVASGAFWPLMAAYWVGDLFLTSLSLLILGEDERFSILAAVPVVTAALMIGHVGGVALRSRDHVRRGVALVAGLFLLLLVAGLGMLRSAYFDEAIGGTLQVGWQLVAVLQLAIVLAAALTSFEHHNLASDELGRRWRRRRSTGRRRRRVARSHDRLLGKLGGLEARREATLARALADVQAQAAFADRLIARFLTGLVCSRKPVAGHPLVTTTPRLILPEWAVTAVRRHLAARAHPELAEVVAHLGPTVADPSAHWVPLPSQHPSPQSETPPATTARNTIGQVAAGEDAGTATTRSVLFDERGQRGELGRAVER
jgi:hypothetical protein